MATKEEKIISGIRIVGTKDLVKVIGESSHYKARRKSLGEAARNYNKGSYIADVLIDNYTEPNHIEGVVNKKYKQHVQVGDKTNKSLLTFNLPESVFQNLTVDADLSVRSFSGQVRFVVGLHLSTLTKSRSK